MGGNYGAPAPQNQSEILSAYQNYLPSLMSEAQNANNAGAQSGALAQLNATQATQPAYNALNLQQAQQYAVPLAQVGQQVQNSNALAGAQTNLNQITGAGGQAALAATQLNRLANPDYYKALGSATRGASQAINAINLNGLSPGEVNATERANNQNLTGTGNLGLLNNTNSIANAMNFGGAFNSKIGLMNNAVNSATGVANTASGGGGVNAANIALGQPNTSTMGNFGTGTFSSPNASTQNNASNNATSSGNALATNMFSGLTSMNNAATGAAGQLAVANAVPNYIPNVSC